MSDGSMVNNSTPFIQPIIPQPIDFNLLEQQKQMFFYQQMYLQNSFPFQQSYYNSFNQPNILSSNMYNFNRINKIKWEYIDFDMFKYFIVTNKNKNKLLFNQNKITICLNEIYQYFDLFFEKIQNEILFDLIQKEIININELRIYLGLILYFGIIKLPTLEDYWSTDHFFPNFIVSKNLMSIENFKRVHKLLISNLNLNIINKIFDELNILNNNNYTDNKYYTLNSLLSFNHNEGINIPLNILLLMDSISGYITKIKIIDQNINYDDIKSIFDYNEKKINLYVDQRFLSNKLALELKNINVNVLGFKKSKDETSGIYKKNGIIKLCLFNNNEKIITSFTIEKLRKILNKTHSDYYENYYNYFYNLIEEKIKCLKIFDSEIENYTNKIKVFDDFYGIIYLILEIIINNSYIIYEKYCQKGISLNKKEFRISIIKKFLEK